MKANNIKESMKFIYGHEDLNNKELFCLYQSMTPIFGNNFEYIKPNSVFIVSKNKNVYEEMKNKYFCCGFKEFIIFFNKKEIYLAFDY